MTFTDFLNSLTFIHDATTDTLALGMVIGIVAIVLAVACLVFALQAARHLYDFGFEGIVLAEVIGGLFLCTIFVFGTISCFTLPALSLQWIISTDNIDPLALYTYFNVNSAPIDGTVEITPKWEFYQEALSWYTTNFSK